MQEHIFGALTLGRVVALSVIFADFAAVGRGTPETIIVGIIDIIIGFVALIKPITGVITAVALIVIALIVFGLELIVACLLGIWV
jgi:uncharacterized membrane protein HdeD (DUF308 family)